MKIMVRILIFVSLVIVSVQCSSDGAGSSSGGSLSPGDLNWHVRTASFNYGTPAVGSDGTVYAGTNGKVEWGQGVENCKIYAIGSDGSVKWTYELASNQNVLGAVALDDQDNLFFVVGTWDDSGWPAHDSGSLINSSVYSLDKSGNLRWKQENIRTADTIEHGYAAEEPAIAADGTVIVPAQDILIAYNNTDGSVKWTADISASGAMSSPTIAADGTVYINYMDIAYQTDHGVYAINSTDGSVIHKCSLVEGDEMAASSPAIDDNGVVYVGRGGHDTSSTNFYLYALEFDLSSPSCTRKWRFSTGGLVVIGSPAIDSSGDVYIGTSSKPASVAGVFYAIKADGTQKWSYDTSADVQGARDIYTSPALSESGVVYFTSEDRFLYGLDTSNGSVVVKTVPAYQVNEEIAGAAMTRSSPTLASDGSIYIGEAYLEYYCDSNNDCDETYAENNLSEFNHIGALYSIKADSVASTTAQWGQYRGNAKNDGRKR